MGSESLGQAREGEHVKAIVYRRYGSPDVLELREIDMLRTVVPGTRLVPAGGWEGGLLC